MTEEIWKDIVGYEGLYQVSNLGRIKGLKRIFFCGWGYKTKIEKDEVILKQSLNRGRKNYFSIGLIKDKKRKLFFVHRLVANAFIKNPLKKKEVNHLNEITTDNRAINLEWCDRKENVNYGTGQKRRIQARIRNGNLFNNKKTSKKIICLNTGIVYPSIHQAGRDLNIKNPSHIGEQIRGKRGSIYGMKFGFWGIYDKN